MENETEIKKSFIKEQIIIIEKIIFNIEMKKYYNTYILIKNYLNNNNFIWYKDINNIIDNQIQNLFYDIENETELTLTFFKRQKTKLIYLMKKL